MTGSTAKKKLQLNGTKPVDGSPNAPICFNKSRKQVF